MRIQLDIQINTAIFLSKTTNKVNKYKKYKQILTNQSLKLKGSPCTDI